MRTNEPNRKWRIRLNPSFTTVVVRSEKAARKEVNKYAADLYKDAQLRRNNLLIKSVSIEINDGEEWEEYEKLMADELVRSYAEGLND